MLGPCPSPGRPRLARDRELCRTHHFEVQPDEEAASGSLLDGFRNDNFRIEIEEYDIGSSPRQSVSTKAGELGQRDKLVGWYQYHRSQDRMAEQPRNREVVPPPMMTAAAAFTDLVSHLEKVIDKVPAFPQLADDPANAGVKRRVVRIALVGTQSHFSILPTQMTANAAKEPHYGTLLDARLLSFPREGSTRDRVPSAPVRAVQRSVQLSPTGEGPAQLPRCRP